MDIDGLEVHYLATKGVEIRKPTKVWNLYLPAELTEEEYTEIINEFLKALEDDN